MYNLGITLCFGKEVIMSSSKMSKKKILLILSLIVITVLAAISVSATENEGFTFEKGTTYEIRNPFRSGAPSTVEATVYLEDTTAASGVILGNYWYKYTSVVSIDFKIEKDGMPRISIQTGNNTFSNYDFTDVKIESGKFLTLRFVIDRSTEGAHKAMLYVDGALMQTIENEKIVQQSTPQAFVFGGNRNAPNIGDGNSEYFKGKISKLTVWTETVYPEDSETAPLLTFDYSASNTKDVITDTTGNGYDAYYTERFLTKDEIPERIEDYSYTFAVLGDPQYVASNHPDHYQKIYDWIIAQHPEYVIGLGDIQDEMSNTSDAAHEQWKVAQSAIFSLDDAGIPHTHIRGNHDYATIYKQYLPWERYSYIFDGVNAGSYSNNIVNTWRTIEMGDTKWLILGLDYNPSAKVINWAKTVIEEHPEHNVIIASHSYLNRVGNVTNNANSKMIWSELADKYANVVLVLCGHVYSDNIIVNKKVNSVGTTVTEMLIDYQYLDTYYSTPLAIATLFHFSEDGRTLQVENYSTYNEAYYKMANQFTVELDVLDVEKSEIKNEGTPDYELSAATESGTIDGYTWSICDDTLIISGSADTKVLSDASAIASLAASVKKIVIENSTLIEEIGDGLFSGFSACETVILPAKLNKIGSKTFENMTSLKTVALYNDYYGSNFDGNNIINLYDINYFAANSFAGACSSEGLTVYIPYNAIMSGESQKFISADATYYIYPKGNASDLVRDNASDGDTVKYYTYEMTGNARLTTEGTNLLRDNSGNMFTWSFDADSGKLTLNFLGGSALYDPDEGFGEWKKLWKDAVKTIEVYGKASYNKLQIYAGTDYSTGLFDGYKNLVSIYFEKASSGNVCSEWQVTGNSTDNKFGMFSDNPKLTTIGLGQLTEGVVDLTGLTKVSGVAFNKMFSGCSSITKVIVPSKTNMGDLKAHMFEGCTSLQSVTLPTNLTKIGANSFSGCTSLKYLTLPAGVVTIDETAFDSSMTVLTGVLDTYNTVKGYGFSAAIDLRETALDDFAIERNDTSIQLTVFLKTGKDVTEYSASALMEKFGENVKYIVYPSTPGADAVRALKKDNDTIKLGYYSTDLYSELTRSGKENQSNTSGAGYFYWSFDESTGKLTFTLDGYDFMFRTYSLLYTAWKNIWRNEIIHISVEGKDQYDKLMNNNVSESIMANMPNLESILFESDLSTIIQNTSTSTGVFAGNPSLKSLGWGTLTEGVIDLSKLSRMQSANHHKDMFKGCSSIKKVIMPTNLKGNSGTYQNKTLPIIAEGMFNGCTSLSEIVIPSYFTTVNANAFEGCTSLDYLVLGKNVTTVSATAFDGTDTKIICFDETQINTINTALASGTTNAKATLYGSLSAEGISIRLTSYNGLRFIYSFDNKEAEEMKNAGFELKEYGIIFSSAEKKDLAFVTGNNGEYISGDGTNKVAVYNASYAENNGFCGKYLSTSTSERTDFAGTITNFTTEYMKRDVYVAAYSVYTDKDGNEYIRHLNYGEVNAEYETANLFETTFAMLADAESGIKEQHFDDAAVFNTLLIGADIEDYKNTAIEGFSSATLTLAGDGNGNYLAIIKNGSAETLEKVKTMLSDAEYTIIDYILVSN